MDSQQEWLSRLEMYNDYVDDVLVFSGGSTTLGKDGHFYTGTGPGLGLDPRAEFPKTCTVHK
jgi:hypothetical protein